MPAPLMDMKGPSHHQAFFLQQQQFFFFFFPQLFFYRLKKWRGNLKRRINFQNSAKTQTCLTSFFGGGVFPKKIVQKGSKKSSELSRKSDGFLPPNHQRWDAKMEAQSECVLHVARTFCADFCMLILTKYMLSLLRVPLLVGHVYGSSLQTKVLERLFDPFSLD